MTFDSSAFFRSGEMLIFYFLSHLVCGFQLPSSLTRTELRRIHIFVRKNLNVRRENLFGIVSLEASSVKARSEVRLEARLEAPAWRSPRKEKH